MADSRSIVLVHGAWHGPWVWDKVAGPLRERGFDVHAVDLPSIGPDTGSLADMYGDAAAVRAALDEIDGEALVVAHSYGGVATTEGAAGAGNVAHIVYLTAFMLDEGQALADVAGRTPPAWQVPNPDGKTVRVEGPQGVFYNTCTPEIADAAAARLRPHTIVSFVQPVRSVGWRDVPSTYVVCELDNAIPVPAQEAMAAHAGTTRRLRSDHSPFLTDPDAVAELIRGVA